MHEQSETIQLPSGRWANVYGRGTPQAGQRLPGTADFATVQEATAAAGARSAVAGQLLQQKGIAPAPPSQVIRTVNPDGTISFRRAEPAAPQAKPVPPAAPQKSREQIELELIEDMHRRNQMLRGLAR